MPKILALFPLWQPMLNFGIWQGEPKFRGLNSVASIEAAMEGWGPQQWLKS